MVLKSAREAWLRSPRVSRLSGVLRACALIVLAGAVVLMASVARGQVSTASQAATVQAHAYSVPLMYSDATRPTVAVIGDSYASGAGASSQAKRFVNLVAAKLNWRVVLLSRGGTGYVQALTGKSAESGCGQNTCAPFIGSVAQLQKLQPSAVLVFGGRNDAAIAAGSESNAINSFYSRLRTTLPNARVYAVLPIWGADPAPASIDRMRSDVANAARRIQAEVLDIGEPLQGRTDLMFKDDVHPNDKGHARIAALLETAVNESNS